MWLSLDLSPLAIDTDRTGAADGLAAVVEAGVDAQTGAYYPRRQGPAEAPVEATIENSLIHCDRPDGPEPKRAVVE